MRILQVHNFSNDINGEYVYFSSLLDLLTHNKQDVWVFTKSNKDIPRDFSSNLYVAKEMFWNKKLMEEFSLVINKFSPDIAHFHNLYPLITPIAYKICRNQHIPVVQTVYNYKFLCARSFLFRDGQICELCVNKKYPYPSYIYGCYHRSHVASLVYTHAFLSHRIIKAFDKIDKFIFPAKFTQDYYIKNLSISPGKTTLIPFFVSREKIKSISFNKRDFFLFVGRLSEEKGIIQLLDVFSSTPDIELVVIGDGPLRERVNKYKKFKNISIKGFQPKKQVFHYLHHALCTIIPFLWYDVLPMVLVESFTNATPVMVPKFGTFNDLIKEGRNGFFYEYNNYKDLRKKILYVWGNKDKLQELRTYARKEYEAKYTPEKHYQALLKVYQDLVR